MDSSSYPPLPRSPLPLKPVDSCGFPPLPPPEELRFLCPDVTLPADFCSVGSLSTFGAQVSSDFSPPLSSAFPFDSSVPFEDLDFLEAQLDFGADDSKDPSVGFPQNPNVGFAGFAESNLIPENPAQNAHFESLRETQKVYSLGEGKKGTEIATVPVDMIRNRRPFRCTHAGCEKTFKNPQTLSMHFRTHDKHSSDALVVVSSAARAGQNKKIPGRCPVCKRVFVGLYELRRHFGRKHSEGEKRHDCKKCGKKFYVEVDLRDHEKLCGELVGCKCGLRFAFKCNLSAHQRTHPECVGESSSHADQRSSAAAKGRPASSSPSHGVVMGVKLEDVWSLACRARFATVVPGILRN